MTVPTNRITARNEAPLRPDGDFVLYWMTSSRRAQYNFGLQRAVEWSNQVERPLLVLEPEQQGVYHVNRARVSARAMRRSNATTWRVAPAPTAPAPLPCA